VDTGTPHTAHGACLSSTWTDDAEARLIGLCEAFIRHAQARTVEGDRLDGLAWSSEVNAGYLELTRDAHDHGAMLAAILAIPPSTMQGLVAKARVICRHHQDPEAEPIPAGVLAADVLRLLGARDADGAGGAGRPDRDSPQAP
jgi:hypothetical protein